MQHPDEGTIHAWLDGALPPEDAARLESHVAECEKCAAVLVEARGFVAGASRILSALDDAPRDVVPVPVAGATASEPMRKRAPIAGAPVPSRSVESSATRRARHAWLRAPLLRAAAAIALVAAGLATLTRGAGLFETRLPRAASEAASEAVAARDAAEAAPPAAAPVAAAEPAGGGAAATSATGAAEEREPRIAKQGAPSSEGDAQAAAGKAAGTAGTLGGEDRGAPATRPLAAAGAGPPPPTAG